MGATSVLLLRVADELSSLYIHGATVSLYSRDFGVPVARAFWEGSLRFRGEGLVLSLPGIAIFGHKGFAGH
jgi:hypothetical protein